MDKYKLGTEAVKKLKKLETKAQECTSRKKAIKLQNASSSKLSMAEALRRVKFESDSV